MRPNPSPKRSANGSPLRSNVMSALGRELPLRDPLASGSFGGHSGRAWLSGVLVRASAPPRVQRHHHAERTGDLARTGSSGPDVTALHHSNQKALTANASQSRLSGVAPKRNPDYRHH